MLTIGDVAPDFELISDEETPIKLSDYRGQQVILFFYPKADTPGCTKQACGFRDNYFVFEATGATVFGISPDTPKALAKWRQKMGFQYKLLSDPDHAVADAYNVWGEKSFMGKRYQGIIRSHFVVDADGKIADVQVDVKPDDSVTRAINFVGDAA